MPHSTYSFFLLPLLHQNRLQEAAEFYRKSTYLITGQAGFLSAATNHLKYLTVVDQDKAISQFEKYLPQALASNEPNTRFGFYRAAVVLFDYLDTDSLQVLQMPEGVTPETIKDELYTLAEKFDQRNGNDGFKKSIGELKEEIAGLKKRLEMR